MGRRNPHDKATVAAHVQARPGSPSDAADAVAQAPAPFGDCSPNVGDCDLDPFVDCSAGARDRQGREVRDARWCRDRSYTCRPRRAPGHRLVAARIGRLPSALREAQEAARGDRKPHASTGTVGRRRIHPRAKTGCPVRIATAAQADSSEEAMLRRVHIYRNGVPTVAR